MFCSAYLMFKQYLLENIFNKVVLIYTPFTLPAVNKTKHLSFQTDINKKILTKSNFFRFLAVPSPLAPAPNLAHLHGERVVDVPRRVKLPARLRGHFGRFGALENMSDLSGGRHKFKLKKFCLSKVSF